jgi:hypothetical protein
MANKFQPSFGCFLPFAKWSAQYAYLLHSRAQAVAGDQLTKPLLFPSIPWQILVKPQRGRTIFIRQAKILNLN